MHAADRRKPAEGGQQRAAEAGRDRHEEEGDGDERRESEDRRARPHLTSPLPSQCT